MDLLWPGFCLGGNGKEAAMETLLSQLWEKISVASGPGGVEASGEPAAIDKRISYDLSDALRHGALVSRLAAKTAKELGESEEVQEEAALAGMLHDIGKLKLGKYLYGRRKDSLSIEEMKYMRMHPTFSYNILKRENVFSDKVLKAVYHHHENYDGSGYPYNLKGRDIPWLARIIRPCDAFSALVSDRPYREAFDIDTAVELMIDEVKNFDMQVFLAFLSIIHSDDFETVRDIVDYNHEIYNQKAFDKLWETEVLQKVQ